MFSKSMLFVVFAVGSSLVHAKDFSAGNNAVRGVYDGDTFNLAFRLAYIDTPEIKGKCPLERQLAVEAQEFTEQFLRSSDTLQVDVIDVGYYGRPLVEVRSSRGYLNKMLLEQGYAVEYSPDRDANWCSQ